MDGGGAYLIRNDGDASEFFLLENRQQQSFDHYLPGHGLLVTHIGYYALYDLTPNNGYTVLIHPVPADNLDYKWSYKKYVEDYYGVTLPDNKLSISKEYKKYQYDDEGRSRIMTGTAYPYVLDGTVMNDCLTDDSTPAAVLRNPNVSGEKLLSKPVTDIRENNGLVSFHFMAPTSLVSSLSGDKTIVAVYDLYGRQLSSLPVSLSPSLPVSLYIIRYSDGTVKKIHR